MRDEIKRGRVKKCRICRKIVRHHNKTFLCNRCAHKMYEVRMKMAFVGRCKKCRQGRMQLSPNHKWKICNMCSNSEPYKEPEIDEKFVSAEEIIA